MAFGEQWIPLAGVPGPILSTGDLLQQAYLPAANITPNFNMATMVWFQAVFAAITIALIGGALLGRMNFTAWVIFVPLYLTLSYSVGAFSIWAGGFLYQLGPSIRRSASDARRCHRLLGRLCHSRLFGHRRLCRGRHRWPAHGD